MKSFIHHMRVLLSLFLVQFIFVSSLTAQYRLRDIYKKIERMIPMRDGVQLFTSIYIPLDSSESHPILLSRTPYSCEPYGENNFPHAFSNPSFAKENYIVVYQDVRGRHMSGGRFTEVTP